MVGMKRLYAMMPVGEWKPRRIGSSHPMPVSKSRRRDPSFSGNFRSRVRFHGGGHEIVENILHFGNKKCGTTRGSSGSDGKRIC
jgi:hypothetical protein